MPHIPAEIVPLVSDYGVPARPRWREIEWARHQRNLTIDGRRVRVVQLGGRGELCWVLVHGMAGTWRHWVETLPTLARRGRVVALDLPGFGASEHRAGGANLCTFADSVADVCAALDLHGVMLVGHSMGGSIGLECARRHPALVRRLVTVGTTVLTLNPSMSARELLTIARGHRRAVASILLEVLTVALPAPPCARRMLQEHPSVRRFLLSPYFRDAAEMPADMVPLMLDGVGTAGALPTLRALARLDPKVGVADVRCPVLSVGGTHDRVAPPDMLLALMTEASNVTTVLFEGAGHMVMLERPEAFNDRLVRFATETIA